MNPIFYNNRSQAYFYKEQFQQALNDCNKAIELAKDKTSVYWCNTNNESSLLKNMDSEAVEIIGSQSIEKKEEAPKTAKPVSKDV